MIFPGSLSDSKSLQVCRTLLSILTDLNNVVVWKVSTRTLISKSSSHCTNPLVTIPKSTIYNWYNRHFHVPQFFQFPRKVQVIIPLFAFIHFYSVVRQDSKVYNSTSSFFFSIIIRSGCLTKFRRSVCISKSLSLCFTFSRTNSWLCIYHLSVMVKVAEFAHYVIDHFVYITT